MRYDAATGEYRTAERVHDPSTDRFLSPDPSPGSGTNLSVGCGNNWTDGSDPSGLWPTGPSDGGSDLTSVPAYLGPLQSVVADAALSVAGDQAMNNLTGVANEWISQQPVIRYNAAVQFLDQLSDEQLYSLRGGSLFRQRLRIP